MAGRVVLHSWHSHVLDTLANHLDSSQIETLLSFDSHLDMHLVTQDEEEWYPTELLVLAAARAAAHSQIRYLLSGQKLYVMMTEEEKLLQPTMCVAVPIGEIRALIRDLTGFIGGPSDEGTEVSVSDVQELYDEMFGVGIFLSPPRKLHRIIEHMQGKDVVFDIDVDYFYEMQSECYSPKINAKPSDLGRLDEILRLIKKIRPSLITVSEAKSSARNNHTSTFSRFIEWLRRHDYSVEESEVFDDDSEPEKALRMFEQYWRTVREPANAKVSSLMEIYGEEYREKMRQETLRFFSERAG